MSDQAILLWLAHADLMWACMRLVGLGRRKRRAPSGPGKKPLHVATERMPQVPAWHELCRQYNLIGIYQRSSELYNLWAQKDSYRLFIRATMKHIEAGINMLISTDTWVDID